MLNELLDQTTFTAVDFDPFAFGELLLLAPVTEAQKEIWLSVQMGDAANCAYNESLLLRLCGDLDVDALTFALQHLVLRHEALRTTFSPDGMTLCVAVNSPISVPLSDLSDSDNYHQLTELLEQEVRQPFNLVFGSLFRAQIIRCSPQEHFLILTAHHIVCDGWSWGVLLPDLAMLYSSARQQVTAPLNLAECFSEYALWQASLIKTPEYAAADRYWMKQFADRIPILDLPIDRPRPKLRSYSAAREDWQVNPSLIAALKRLGAKAGCSFFTTLLAGFEAFLYRWSNQADLVVGVPAAGQSFTGRDTLVGHCVNFLPIRSHVDGQQTIMEYLRQRNPDILDAYEYQQMTYGALVKKLTISRDASRIPLASVAFNLDRPLTGKELPFAELEVEVRSNPRAFENFEISINASEANGNLVLECQYNTDLFDRATIRRRLEAFEVLLTGMAANPHQAIAKLPILPQTEEQQMQQWNQTQREYAADQCIHHLVEAQAEQTPDAIAVVFENQQLTYRELNQQANQLAHYLQTLGAKTETLVGICVERSIDMIVGLLAILKAGSAYVPLDPAHPSDRLAYVLQDTAAPILLTQTALLDCLPAHQAQVVCLDANQSAIRQQPQENPVSEVTATNLAYVIYTSGSTGLPKGVPIEHRSVVNLLESVRSQPGLTAQDTLLSVTTITFDISVAEIFLPLIVGARLVVVSRTVASDGKQLLRALNACNPTFMQATPVTWQLLLAAGWRGSPQLKIISTGEALPKDLANQLLTRGAELWNLYGPTETTIWSAAHRITSSADPILIGYPLANTQFYILDAHLQPVPIGIPGELYIGGDGVARGYLDRPELTTDRFIANPFAPGTRLYKTGDLARYLPDGAIECLGRIDHQVKIRGFRIELGEIEAILGQHPAVREVVVVAREEMGNKRLVAYIVPQGEQSPGDRDLRTFASRKLPDYMLPTAYILLNQLPLTGSGKVDRKALPAPGDRSPQTDFVAPRTPIEQQLSELWKRVLGVQSIGITDNFFELGGHSLLATQLLAEIEKSFNKTLPLATIFQAATIEQMAKRIDQSEGSIDCPSLVIIQDSDIPQPPLFAIHVLGRGLEFYRPLVTHLKRSQLIYGLSTQIMDEALAPANRVEDLAAFYIEEMKGLQPEGPYFLTGVSFGGVVAFEIAQQLHEQGETVALLALLDTYASVVESVETNPIFRVIELMQTEQANELLKKIKMNLQGKIEKFNDCLLRLRCKFHQRLGHQLSTHLQDFTYTEENDRALTSYTLKPYAGQVVLFAGSEAITGISPESGWRKLITSGLEIHQVPGDHLGILKEPNVRVLGKKLQVCLDAAKGHSLLK